MSKRIKTDKVSYGYDDEFESYMDDLIDPELKKTMQYQHGELIPEKSVSDLLEKLPACDVEIQEAQISQEIASQKQAIERPSSKQALCETRSLFSEKLKYCSQANEIQYTQFLQLLLMIQPLSQGRLSALMFESLEKLSLIIPVMKTKENDMNDEWHQLLAVYPFQYQQTLDVVN